MSDGVQFNPQHTRPLDAARNAGTSPWEIWYSPMMASSAGPSVCTVTADQLYLLKWVVGRAIVTDSMAVNITTANTNPSSFRIGVWGTTAPANEYPLTKLFDSGTVTTTAAAVYSTGATLALAAGTYWLGVTFRHGHAVRGNTSGNQVNNSLGTSSALGTSPNYGAYVSSVLATTAFTTTLAGHGTATLLVSGGLPYVYYRQIA